METSQAVAYPEPHQGVAGEDRYGDPLVMTEEASTLVGDLVWKLYRSSLGPTPASLELFKRMTHPKPGDRVVVSDSVNHQDPDTRFRGVGYLVTTRAEWATTRSVWERDQADGDLADQERVVERQANYVQYGPNPADVCRWVNCDVLAIP